MLKQPHHRMIEYSPTPAGIAGTFIWDVSNDRLYADATVADMFFIRAELARTGLALDCFLQRIHPNDRERVVDAVDRAVQSKGEYSEIYTVVAEDGRQRVVLVRGACYGADDNQKSLFPGTVLDLSDILNSEEEALARIGDLCIDAWQIARRHRMGFLGQLLGMTLLETGNELARMDRKSPNG